MTKEIIIIAITGIIFLALIFYLYFNSKITYPDLERQAELLAISRDVKEIRAFINANMNYLTEKSFKMLLSRIEELEADNTLFNELYDKENRNNK